MKMKLNNKIMKCLFTCSHIISYNDINNKIIINIFYGKKGKEEERNIRLDEDMRFIRTFNNNEDITLIEIIENDNIPEDKYLDPDLNYENGFNQYENKNFYLAGYTSNFNERSFSSGRIIKVLDNKFEYMLDKNVVSSGSPICNYNCDVIGISTSGNKVENINFGSFIGKIIDSLNNIYIIYNNNSNNYIIGEIYVNDNDINNDIRIINSFEQYKRENPDVEGDCTNENERELQQNIEIKINNIAIKFSYFYKFKVSGKYRIEYYFKKNMLNTNFMFCECTSLTNLNLSNFNTQNVTNMRSMFNQCSSLTNLNLSNFNTQNVTDMRCMFSECSSLSNLNLSNFNTQNVTDMRCMFCGCSSLSNLNL